jgi:phenylalanyl-tRNA synthetase beta chain
VKFSLEWLREYVDPGPDPARAGSLLTAVGIPLDSLEATGDDTVLDFDVTTNRPDCMNHFGLARELAVAAGAELREPARELPLPLGPRVSDSASLDVEAGDLCGRYTALLIRGVCVGTSPPWLSRRLSAIGQRPINAVVDATNYVLWELGHPLHAFDLSRLSGRRIRVRRARAGEPLTTLDGVQRRLDPETLVIADEARAVAVAGVMGGLDSEISSATSDVLLESAHFDPVSVRRTARRLGLHTDASHRFERGADLEATMIAASRCARLITEVAGGTVAGGALEARSAPPFSRSIPLRPERVCRLLGLEVPETAMRRILEQLGCRVDNRDRRRWDVAVPSFRGDLALEEDLVEEIARHHGYDKIPSTLPRVLVFPEGRPEADRRMGRVREAMVRSGFSESLNLSLVSTADNESLGRHDGGVKVANPLAEGQDRLRTTLLPGVLRNLAHNRNHGAAEVRLFEIGRAFLPAPTPGAFPEEEEILALCGSGREGLKHWSEPARPLDLFDLKGAVDLSAHLLGLPPLSWRSGVVPFLCPGTAALLSAGEVPAGCAGELLPSLGKSFGLEGEVFVAEVSLDRLFAGLPAGFVPRHAPLSRTPSVRRDLSLILDQNHTYAEVEETIRSVNDPSIASLSLFDRYRGRPVPDGKVGMAVSIQLRSPGRTLVSGEVSELLHRIVQRLRERLGAELRGN